MIYRFLLCAVCLYLHIYTLAQPAGKEIFSIKSIDEDSYFPSMAIAGSPIKFDFKLKNQNKMRLELVSLSQLDSLPNMDTLIDRVWRYIKEVDDSLEDLLSVTRVDFDEYKGKANLRLQRFPSKTGMFAIDGKEIVQLKTKQDTLNISIWPLDPGTKKPRPCIIHLHLNYLTDLDSIRNSGEMGKAIQLLKNDLSDKVNTINKRKSNLRYYAAYEVEKSTRITPAPGWPVWTIDGAQPKLALFVQAGIQYINGAWATSGGLGFSISQHYFDGRKCYFSLYWEPYFSFRRPTSAKAEGYRSDFVTLQYDITAPSNDVSSRVTYMKSIAISYLVHNQGNLFDKNTFKISVPRFAYYNLSIAPEFVFSGFFKKFSPSVKLVVSFNSIK